MRFLKPYKFQAVCAPLFKMFEAILELFVPLVMTKIIDEGIAPADKEMILRMGLLLVLLAALGLAASVTAQYFAARTAVGFARDMKNELFRHVTSLSFSKLDTVGTSKLITRMTSDSDRLQNGVNMTLRLFLRSPFIVFGSMIMAYTVDASLAVHFFWLIPVLFAVVFGIMLGTVPMYRRVQNAMDRIVNSSREMPEGVRVIRAFNLRKNEENNFFEETDNYTRLQLGAGRISALLNPVTFVFVNLALFLILSGGTSKILAGNGALTTGKLVAIVNYLSQILVELIKLADLVILMTRSLASAKRIEEVFDIHE